MFAHDTSFHQNCNAHKLLGAVLAAVAAMLVGASAMACPDYTEYGETHELTEQELYAGMEFSVRAGGRHALSECKFRGVDDEGYVTAEPDFTFELSEMDGYHLELVIESDCDSILLINTADRQWLYDDDSAGDYDAMIVLQNPSSGYLDVWIGTYDGEYCDAWLNLEAYRSRAEKKSDDKKIDILGTPLDFNAHSFRI